MLKHRHVTVLHFLLIKTTHTVNKSQYEESTKRQAQTKIFHTFTGVTVLWSQLDEKRTVLARLKRNVYAMKKRLARRTKIGCVITQEIGMRSRASGTELKPSEPGPSENAGGG